MIGIPRLREVAVRVMIGKVAELKHTMTTQYTKIAAV